MDVVERLTLEAAQADTMLAAEHRHRYEFAAAMCADARVLDLCCGSGYGSRILAARARRVVGVDRDVATIEMAAATVAAGSERIEFEAADAIEFLSRDIAGLFDVCVCFEGLEHLQDLDGALALLRGHAARGLRIVASVPNDKLLGADNPFHTVKLGLRETERAFADFPDVTLIAQFLAEGSLICPPEAQGVDVAVSLEDRYEPEYANHFIVCVNVGAEVPRVHHGTVQVNVSPVFNRWSEDLKRGAWALRRENARLARARLGQGGAAAAEALARIASRENAARELEARCRTAEARVAELEAALTAAGSVARRTTAGGFTTTAGAREAPGPGSAHVLAARASAGEGWEQRRARASVSLVPWVLQATALAGKHVLDIGCGDGAVGAAMAAQGATVSGIDSDREAIAAGVAELSRCAVAGVELRAADLDAWPAGPVDVVVLNGLLERLSWEQRLETLSRARERLAADGVIVVTGTPNRLLCTFEPFPAILPPGLADEYARATGAGTEAEADGVSFHEFEIVFPALAEHLRASAFDPLLLADRAPTPDELALARRLGERRPDLVAAFARRTLDLVLARDPGARRPPLVRPLFAQVIDGVDIACVESHSVILNGPRSRLALALPEPSSTLVLATAARGGESVLLQARDEQGPGWISAAVEAGNAPSYVNFAFDAPVQRVVLRVDHACRLLFVGYGG